MVGYVLRIQVGASMTRVYFPNSGCMPTHMALLGGPSPIGVTWAAVRIISIQCLQDISDVFLSFFVFQALYDSQLYIMVKIFIGNIADGARSTELKSMFEKYGNVTECSILTNFGFVVSLHNIALLFYW